MPSNRNDLLCRYHYDPLDRLISTTSIRDAKLQRFYCKTRLVTESQGVVQRSIFQLDDQLLAQRYRESNAVETSLLATDQMRSVLRLIKSKLPSRSAITYSPYGYRPAENGLLSLLGFNGERPDTITGHYLLGNGYRAFNSALMRFNSPDNLSPFGKGGLNPYVYCLGDPINQYDETGHFPNLKTLRSIFNVKKTETLDIVSPRSYVDRLHEGFMSAQNEMAEPAIRHIKKAKDLEYIPAGGVGKFVLTKDKKLIVGRLWSDEEMTKLEDLGKPSFVHHGSLTKAEKSTKVLSAGYIYMKEGGAIRLDNVSGHYKPESKTLVNVVNYVLRKNISKSIEVEFRQN